MLVLRQFFLGFIKIHILHHAAQQPVYGQALIAELQHHGYEISPGTLYPILHGLEKAGYLTREDRVIAGRRRKYYTATESGAEALAEAREKIRELVDEVVDGQGPEDIESRSDPG
ncbi:PadR family transcriptional regulator [Salinisphaera hydrothermalis]|uniref:PadR-like family transcriptional regulator n=1 Tax=Salinisphaera hydrothermalis (strain C41B8) TaxID=1304275 RepID=A0A084IH41_SALHC|nr:PadR family transcriptional regulator [Salinisphaera hydrothermalis]KEZ76025.1 PadR-like family transcriptional regulator [Salinisphaera hydrothermalis C41B8]